MKPGSLRRVALTACATLTCSLSAGAPPSLSIAPGSALSWSTTSGKSYQPQVSTTGGPWTNLGSELPGDGQMQSVFSGGTGENPAYQVLEIIPGEPGGPVTANAVVNGGFESGNGADAHNWSKTSGEPPVRTGTDAHQGAFSMRGLITGLGSEGLLNQRLVPQGSSVTAGRTYHFSFWAKQISSGPSYVQQYEMQWLNGSGGVVGGTGLQNFSASIGQWQKISVPSLVAPAGAADAKVTFRFVTGAVTNAGGEVLIDDVALESTTDSGPPGPPQVLNHPFTTQSVANLSWPTVAGMEYQPQTATELSPANWSNLTSSVTGDGNPASILVPMTLDRQFFRVEYPVVPVFSPSNLHTVYAGIPDAIGLAWDASSTPGVTGYRILFGPAANNLSESLVVGNVTSAVVSSLTAGQTYFFAVVAITADGESPVGTVSLSAQPETDLGIVALYNSATVLEPATTVDTPTARITRFSDRARDRHAREDMFNAYDHYLTWYWEQRMANIEIIDRIPMGGTTITVNFTTHGELNPAEFRAFFRGINTVAEYHFNAAAPLISTSPSATPGETDYTYSVTITAKQPGGTALQIGDRIELEISQFLLAPRNGRSNYYGTTVLYVVGQGIVPWAEGQDLGFDGGIVNSTNQSLDSYPLPVNAWLGGLTTLPYQYSNEPDDRFKQTAGNISPTNGQPFMLGRRLHHTEFDTGIHTEPGNPVFTGQIGKLGPKYVTKSCVECHGNNGRALPPLVGAPLLQHGIRVGSDATGAPHPVLGEQLQPKTVGGPGEAGATLASYTTTNGQYNDGTAFSLRKPNYAFQGVSPSFFSVRVAPQLVGLGLLEAVAEASILNLADPNDSDEDGISGRIQVIEDPETGDPRLGRFGYKASQARVDHQIAHALNYDMGVTTSVFPILDGAAAASPVELDDTSLDLMNRYVSLLGVGARRDLSNAQALQGEQLFQTASCVDCHTPTLTTSPHHPMTELRNQTIHPYTDLLLHDMGPGLADNMGEENASGSEWRTPPLWNIGLTSGVSGGEAYLHDGRARTLQEAILWHGGEGEASKQAFLGMSAADRAALIAFLKSL